MRNTFSLQLFMATYDFYGLVRSTWKTVVYVARYGNGQQIDVIEHWPLSKLKRVAGYLSDMIEKENKATK